jgi:hypothetical protein
MGYRIAGVTALHGVIPVLGLWLASCTPQPGKDCTEVAREPNISPDYSGTVIPPNIAPLNFAIREPGQCYVVKIRGERGTALSLAGRAGRVCIPAGPWRALLAANKGGRIFFEVWVGDAKPSWRRFQTISSSVAQEEIDDTVVFRLMKPVYSAWKEIGIYQRSLQTYDQSVVLHGRSFGEGCLNCHSFAANSPDLMTIGLRSQTYGDSALLARNGTVTKIGARWGYTAWHPSGRLAVYSINKVRQFYHAGGTETRDVVDLDSALACYHADTQTTVCPPPLAEKDRLETYPSWSPDGRTLYYCSAPILWKDRETVPPERFDQVRYDIRRISYDPEKDKWGEPETVVSAEQTGLSCLLPRVSPDGRFLLFCMCRYGCFPVYQPSSDLAMIDLSTGGAIPLAINSEYSESWHSWSSNGRWIAFSSKRQGGLFTRTYLSYVDRDGRAAKPFVVPQRDPATYDRQLETYSVPELVKGPVKIGRVRLARAARSEASVKVSLPITGATPPVRKPLPSQERE